MPAAPPGAAPYPPFGRVQRVRPEARLQPLPHLAGIDAQGPQRRRGTGARAERRPDPAQLRPGRVKVQPAGSQQPGGRAGAVPEQPEEHMLTGHARMTELAGLGEGQVDDLPAVRGQPRPHRARPVIPGRGTHHPAHPPPHQGSLRPRRTRSPCL
jgi:hypothetical protein